MVYFYVLITQSFSVEDNSSWCYDILVTFFSLVFDHIKYYTLHEQITFFNFFIQQSPHRKLSLYQFHRVIKSTIGEIHSHYLNVSYCERQCRSKYIYIKSFNDVHFTMKLHMSFCIIKRRFQFNEVIETIIDKIIFLYAVKYPFLKYNIAILQKK